MGTLGKVGTGGIVFPDNGGAVGIEGGTGIDGAVGIFDDD